MVHIIISELYDRRTKVLHFVDICEQIITFDWNLTMNNVTLIVLYPEIISFALQRRYGTKGLKIEYHKLQTDIELPDVTNVSYSSHEKRNNKISQLGAKLIVLSDSSDEEIGQTDLWKKINGSKYHFNVNKELNTDVEQKYNLINRNLQEVINKELILPILRKRNLKIYWGTAPTKSCHIGYLYPFMKIADLVKAGCQVTILIADLHAFLDNMKSPLETIEKRTLYYMHIILSSLIVFGADVDKINFVKGSDFQLDKKYTLDVYKLCNITKNSDAIHAGTEVVKQTENPLLTSMLYPLLQSLDEEYLNCDGTFGGIDQRKIYTYSVENMYKLGHRKRFYLMNPIVAGLSNCKTMGEDVKMSSSDPNGKISLDDSVSEITKKINKTYCLDGDIIDNTILKLMKNLIFKILEQTGKKFVINRPEKYGGKIEFNNYDDLEFAFSSKSICAPDLKLGFTDFITSFLEKTRNKFLEEDMVKLKKDCKY